MLDENLPGERRLTPPAVANGRVLVGTWDGRLVSLEAASGEVRWEVPVGAPVHWQPIMSGGRVFAGLENGTVVCVQTGDPLAIYPQADINAKAVKRAYELLKIEGLAAQKSA